MNNSTQMINFNGLTCVRLQAGGYEALVAYEVGSNVIRLRAIYSSAGCRNCTMICAIIR